MSNLPAASIMPTIAFSLAGLYAARFGALPNVVAVAVAGSRPSGMADVASDIDVYVYADGDIPVAVRAGIAGDAARRELDNRFWEPGDTWVDLATGLTIDVMYRAPSWIEAELDRVLVRHEASVGYSTCLWHNVRTSVPLFDRDGWFARLQARAAQPYPEALRRAIVAKNHPILRDSMFSFLRQIEDALRRRDAVAVNHRLTALLASYFDIVFALNAETHPGEKRLVAQAEARCPKRPEDFAHRIDELLAAAPAPWDDRGLVHRAHALIDALDGLLLAEGLLARGFDAVGETGGARAGTPPRLSAL